MIRLTRSISVSSFDVEATVAVGRNRPEFLAVARLAADLGRPIGDVRACGVVHEQFRKMEQDAGRYPLRYDLVNPTTRVPVTREPKDIHMVVAGGRSYFASVLPGWGGFGGFAVTRQIRRPGGR